MSAIHLVIGSYDYESSTVLLAYKSKKKADAMRDALTEHRNKKPLLCDKPVNKMTDEDFSSDEKKRGEWNALRPGGINHEHDSYYVQTIEVSP